MPADPTPAAPDPQHVTVTLTRAECHAISQFMSYGATRGNHSWTPERGEGTGPSPGPLTDCINDMCEANRKIMEAMRLGAAPDQAEGPQPPKNVPEPTGEFGHFCPACRALVRWNAQHGWYFCQRCNKARGAVEIMYFRGNQLDAEGYTVDPRDAASKMREIL